MSYTYVRSTRPIGRYDRPKVEKVQKDIKPHLMKLFYKIIEKIYERNYKNSFQKIKNVSINKKNSQAFRKIGIDKMSQLIKRIQDRLKLQSIFHIRNFTPKEIKSNFDEINWHREGNQVQPLDPSNSIFRGINYTPFRRANKIQRTKKVILLEKQSFSLMCNILNITSLKQKSKAFNMIKQKALFKNQPLLRSLAKIKNIFTPILFSSFLRIRYQTNKLFLKPRKQEEQKFKTRAALDSQMLIIQQRRNILKQGINREKAYRDDFILSRDKQLTKRKFQLQQTYESQAQELTTMINRQQLYLQHVFGDQILQNDQYNIDYFIKLQSIYFDLNEIDKSTVSKRGFINKYQIQSISPNIELLLTNINLWRKVKSYQRAMGLFQTPDYKLQQQLRSAQNELNNQNDQIKSTISYYVRQQYGKNHQKQGKILNHLQSQLNEIEEKLAQNKIQQVKIMLT